MHWVSPWRTTAVDEDGSDWDVRGSGRVLVAETDSLSGEWDSPPKSLRDDYAGKDWETGSFSDVDMYVGEEELVREKWPKTDGDYEGDWEEEEEWESSESTDYLRALRGLFPLLQKGQQTNESPWGSEVELELLRDGESEAPSVTRTPRPGQSPRSLSDLTRCDWTLSG